MKRAIVIGIATLVAILLLGGVARALLSVRILSLDTVFSVTGVSPAVDQHGYINVLLLGEGDTTGQTLTDTVIVASIDATRTKSAVLLSLPRDLYFLKTKKMGKGRLNSMFRDYRSYLKFNRGMDEHSASMEALRELKDEIGHKLGLEIHHTIKVDFQGFIEAVDALGGVEIDVPEDIKDEEYPDNNYGFETFEISKGLQHLDGEPALKYARSRSTTSDFSRSQRQQQILSALGQKAKEEKLYRQPGKIIDFFKIFSEHVQSTATIGELIGLAEAGKSLDRSRVIAMQLSDRNALYDSFIEPGGFLYTPPRDLFEGASVLLPVSIPEFPVTWKQIRALVTLMIKTRTAHLARPSVALLNAGGPEGSARRLGTELKRYGFDVQLIENADLPDEIETSAIVLGQESNADITSFFAELLQISTDSIAVLPPEQQRTVTIVLGQDYRYTPLQNLIPSEPTP